MSSSYTPSRKKYDVFISFRGEDTRTNFTSHLHYALCQHKIETYIDYKLDRGEDVWPALSEAILLSHISVVVFSKNYATSKWCLEEIVKIMECRDDHGQVVIPVFYKMDPSHVRNQTGSYEKAFAKHERDLRSESNQYKVSKWKEALTRAAKISGWDSRTQKDDSQVIQNVVNDVLQKLYLRYPTELKGLVEIDENSERVESYLKEVRTVGIWGMGGIGKTTIAKVLFAKLFPQYESVCFLANVREESLKHGLTYLRSKLLFELLKKENLKSNFVGSTFIMRRLSIAKVLIVLDDVDSIEQLEKLCGEPGELGPESKLLITTRDRQLLNGRVNKIYEVENWSYRASLKLFCLNAFKEGHPKEGYEDLSRRAIDYAGGVPLALKVLGSYLYSKSNTFWESELSKLKEYPSEKIQNLLKVSYDGLDKVQQEIFLDIAFFFKGESKDYVIRILNACDFYAASGIEVLEDKALITISNSNRIQMHDLLQELGLDIVRQKRSANPRRRSRLRDIEEVSDIFANDKGIEEVEGIALDLSQIADLHLRDDTFSKMTSLRFLKFYVPLGKRSGNVNLPEIHKPFSDKLRYLEWNGYPLKSLPPRFCAKLLVEIRMPHSHVTELWQGEQDLVNLEGVDVSECKELVKLPNLSRAPKLNWVYLSGCESLPDLDPSILSLDTLTTLILDRCKNIVSLRSEKHSRSLEKLSVDGCSSLKEFSVSSDKIERLDLSNTGIEILHPSIRRLSNLKWLNLEGLRLKNLPDELSCLTSLKELKLSGIELAIDKQKLHVLFDGLRSLEILYLKDCSNLSELPDNISTLSSLRELRLDGSSVKRLPESIKHLKELEILSLENCKNLGCLPELPPFIKEFYAVNCTSLEAVSTLKTFATQMVGKEKHISFENSSKLDESSVDSIMEGAQLTMMSAAVHNVLVRRFSVDNHSYNYNSVEVCLQGSKVPEQFTYRSTESSITIPLPTRSDLLGFLCSVVLSPSIEMKKHGAKIQCQCCLAEGTKVGYESTWHYNAITELDSDHVYVWYDPFHCDKILRNYERKVRFEFSVTTETGEGDGLIGMKECGVRLIYGPEFYTVLRELELELERKVELGLKVGLALDAERGVQLKSALKLLDALEKRLELEGASKLELESRRTTTLMEIERSEEKESIGVKPKIQNQEPELSENCSCDWIVVTESKSEMVDPEPAEEDTEKKKSIESAGKQSKIPSNPKASAERCRWENTTDTEPAKAVKGKGNKENTEHSEEYQNPQEQQIIVLSNIHDDLTVPEREHDEDFVDSDVNKTFEPVPSKQHTKSFATDTGSHQTVEIPESDSVGIDAEKSFDAARSTMSNTPFPFPNNAPASSHQDTPRPPGSTSTIAALVSPVRLTSYPTSKGVQGLTSQAVFASRTEKEAQDILNQAQTEEEHISEDDYLAELENILAGDEEAVEQSEFPAKQQNSRIQEAIQDLKVMLQSSLETISNNEGIRQLLSQLIKTLHDSQDPDAVDLHDFLDRMTTLIFDFDNHYSYCRTTIYNHEKLSRSRSSLSKQLENAKTTKEEIVAKEIANNKCITQLDKEIFDLEQELKKRVEEKEKLKQKNLQGHADKKKLQEKAKLWVTESKGIMSNLNKSKPAYAAAIQKKKLMNDEWENLRKEFFNNMP